MAFFPRRGSLPRFRSDSTAETLIRGVLLILVFGAVIWGFWANSERTMELLEARSSIWDQAELLSKDQHKAIARLAMEFKEEFGFQVKIHIRNTDVELPTLDSKTIFIGLNPATRQVLVEFPPLVRRVLGSDYLYAMQNEHFTPYFDANNVPQGIADALAALWDDLMDAAGK